MQTLASSLRKHSHAPALVTCHVSRVTQHVTSVGARYRGGDRRGKKQEVDYKQHRATVVLLRGVGWERRLGVWINDVIVFVQLEPSAAR